MAPTSRQRALTFGAELKSLGVDYITVTQKTGESKTRLHELCLPLLQQESDRGNRVRSWTMYDYSGYSCGSVQVGSRGDGEIARLSGHQASQHWTMLLPFASNCSRIDIQVTVFYPRESKLVLKSLWRVMRKHRPAVGKVPLATLIESTDGSWTIYTGKRTSEHMGRIYDKGAETRSKLLEGCIRFENEMKGDAAVSLSRRLYLAVDRPGATASGVSRFFQGRGVPSCFFDSILQADLLPATRPGPESLADDARALQWLGKFVRPTVERLISRGKEQDVLVALGLDHDGPSNDDS